MRQHAVHRLDHHEREVQPDTDRESGAEIARRVVMPVIVTVVVVFVMMRVAHRASVGGRHDILALLGFQAVAPRTACTAAA
jgi:ABC-type transport system involved in cytochrome bd biosynthesis fused ATPase/permease subunit